MKHFYLSLVLILLTFSTYAQRKGELDKNAYDKLNNYITALENGDKAVEMPENYSLQDTIFKQKDGKYQFLYEAVVKNGEELVGIFVTCRKVKNTNDKIRYIVIPFSSYNSVINDYDERAHKLGYTMKDHFDFNNAMLMVKYLKKGYDSE